MEDLVWSQKQGRRERERERERFDFFDGVGVVDGRESFQFPGGSGLVDGGEVGTEVGRREGRSGGVA